MELHTSKMRIKLNDDDNIINLNQGNQTQACQSNFEDGFTTTDELDDEIIENRLYLFKVTNHVIEQFKYDKFGHNI